MSTIVSGFINLYRSGHFHTCGKPAAYDRHGGDVYESEGAAIAAIHPASHYIATVPVMWRDPHEPKVNPV